MKEWLSQPWTIWKIVVFIFGLGAIWSSLNYRISALEEFKEEADFMTIKTTLVQIQADIERMKNYMKTNNK